MESKTESETEAAGEHWTLNEPEVFYDEDENPIGLKLHLPKELIEDCSANFWKLRDEEVKKELDAVLCDQNLFDEWCRNQKTLNDPRKLHDFHCMYAYMLKNASERNLYLSGEFCKRQELDRVLGSINLRGRTPCWCCEPVTKARKYISCFEDANDGF